MKSCSSCKKSKELTEFTKRSDSNTLRSHCKTCVHEKAKARYDLVGREFTESQKAQKSIYRKAWKDLPSSKAIIQANNRSYNLKKTKACPLWLSEDQKSHIKHYYELAAYMTATFGQKVDVDHIIPLNGVDVCGLHVPWNLMIMDHTENLRKSNKICI